MSFHIDDTICAIATATGGASRGIVRISGAEAVAIAGRVFESSDGKPVDGVRHASALAGRVRVVLDSMLRSIPCDLFLWPNSRSYTRQPLAELHTIGSPPLLQALLATVCGAGARIAEPGEFTLRAFLAGRLDLTQAEAVLGVIDARGEEELNTALAQLAGGLAQPLHRFREELLQLLAELEAGLDFVEEDIEFISRDELLQRLHSAGDLLGEVEQQMAARHVARDCPQVALVGPPNAGKSSLFNALVQRFGCDAQSEAGQPQSAIVSPQRGTTRDYLIASVVFHGIRCELLDTAGVDDASYNQALENSNLTAIDKAAHELAAERRQRATIRALCIESGSARELGDALDRDVVVLTKADLNSHSQPAAKRMQGIPVVLTSSRTGQGLDELCAEFHELLTRDQRRGGQVVSATADRCRESVRLAEQSIQQAAQLVHEGGGSEFVALELRASLAELGKVVGAVYTDDLLERIFNTFCIGK